MKKLILGVVVGATLAVAIDIAVTLTIMHVIEETPECQAQPIVYARVVL